MNGSTAPDRVAMYAVTRIDHYLGPGASIEARITVKEALPTAAEAEREVRRLNGLSESSEVTYFWQHTRYFPNGRDDRPRK